MEEQRFAVKPLPSYPADIFTPMAPFAIMWGDTIVAYTTKEDFATLIVQALDEFEFNTRPNKADAVEVPIEPEAAAE
jgi:hypothetical protein